MPSAYCVIFAANAATGPVVLVATKAANMPNNPGQVVFPGGRIDGGETPAAAAVREFLEETGVTVDLVHNVIHTTHPVAIAAQEVVDFVGYSALYVRVGSLADLNKVFADVMLNLKNGGTHGELVSAEVMTNRQAHAAFFTENRPANPRLSADWFITISQHAPLG